MILSMLFSLARAESVADYAANPNVKAAMGCAPLSGMLREESAAQLDELMATMGDDLPWMRLMHPAQAKAAGIDLEGGMLLAASGRGDDSGLTAQLAFSGDAAQAEALLRSFAKHVEATEGGWVVGEGDEPLFASLSPGQLQFRSGDTALTPGTGDVPRVLDDIDEAMACVFFVRTEGGTKLPPGEVMVRSDYANPRQNHVLLRADLPSQPAPKMLRKHKAPLNGSSTDAPLLVLTVGVPLKDLADLIPDRPATSGAKAEFASMKVKIKAGTTIAVSGDKTNPSFSAAFKVGGRLGMPHRGAATSGAIARSLEDFGTTYERIDSRTLRVELPNAGPVSGQSLFLGARFGRLYVAMSPEALDTLIEGTGTPWLDAEQADFASRWAIAGRMAMPEVGEVQVGLGARGDVWEAQIHGTNPNADELMSSPVITRALTELGSRLDDAFSEVADVMETGGAEADPEVVEVTRGLCIAELAYEAAFDSFLAAPVHPRPVAELTASAVPWEPVPEAYTTLGFTPTNVMVFGTYWIEGEPTGPVTVHGATDLDGNGEVAHFSASTATGCTVEILDSPGVR